MGDNAGLETHVAECKHCSWIHSAEGPAQRQSPTTAGARLRMKVTGPSKVSYFWTEKQLNTNTQKDYKNHEAFEVLKIFMKAYQKFYFDTAIIRGEVAWTCTIFCKWSKHVHERTVQEYMHVQEQLCTCWLKCVPMHISTCEHTHRKNKGESVGTKEDRVRKSCCLCSSGGTIQIQRPHLHGPR